MRLKRQLIPAFQRNLTYFLRTTFGLRLSAETSKTKVSEDRPSVVIRRRIQSGLIIKSIYWRSRSFRLPYSNWFFDMNTQTRIQLKTKRKAQLQFDQNRLKMPSRVMH